MNMIKRIGYFVVTNLFIMVTVGIAWSLISAFLLPNMQSQIGILMLMCAVMGMMGSFVSLAISRWSAKRFHGVQLIEENTTSEHAWIVSAVHRFARQANLPKMPEVGIYQADDVNAFATGPSKSRSLVAVSTGLLRKMTREEAEGVLGHEVAHIANGDMVTMTLIQGVVNTFALFFSKLLANAVASSVSEKMRSIVYFVVSLVSQIAFTLLGSFIVAWFSRKREFRADLGGANLAGKANMIAALKRLQSIYALPNRDEDVEGDQSLAALKISYKDRGGLSALMSTHPDLQDRIEALQNHRLSV
jgi:heat shock protein HtpX